MEGTLEVEVLEVAQEEPTIQLVTSTPTLDPMMCQPDNSDGCDPTGSWCVPQVDDRAEPTIELVTARAVLDGEQPRMCNPTASCAPDEDCGPDDECGPACNPW